MFGTFDDLYEWIDLVICIDCFYCLNKCRLTSLVTIEILVRNKIFSLSTSGGLAVAYGYGYGLSENSPGLIEDCILS